MYLVNWGGLLLNNSKLNRDSAEPKPDVLQHHVATSESLTKSMNGCYKRSGFALVIAMFMTAILAAWSVSIFAFSNNNVQLASNHQKVNKALAAAQSGIEVARYIVAQASAGLPETPDNTVSDEQADIVWTAFGDKIVELGIGGVTVTRSSELITVSSINYASGEDFTLKFSRSDPNVIRVQSIGNDGDEISRTISMDFSITKDSKVLQYAIASRGRMWITGDSIIRGNIYSSWKYQKLSPFNVTSDSKVLGTISTIITNTDGDLYAPPYTSVMPYDLETLAVNGNPEYDVTGIPVFDSAGNRVYTVAADSASPVYDDDDNILYFEVTNLSDLNGQPVYAGEQLFNAAGQPVYDGSGQPVYVPSENFAYNTQGTKVISSTDEIQGQCEGVNYEVNYGDKAVNMPGMKLSDYDTTQYRNQTTILSTTSVPTVTEYFPHLSGNYTKPGSSSSQKVSRYKYENQTFTNKRVSAYSIVSGTLKGTLFKNCVFDGILYLDCGTTGDTYNNVRFENCTFNGPIITNTPDYSNSTNWWMRNCLYFTGEETFQNNTDIPATILAPNFNVNLGNTNPDTDENNVLKGAIVGGIVDIRGNAEIEGTVISMYDTSVYSSGYVSNIGATLGDGGSETTEPGDIGTINITPNPNKMLPSGIKTPIVIKPNMGSYSESI